MEGRVGGRLYEIQEDGTEVPWGQVLVWEPPGSVVFTWHPGYGSDQAQEVEVRFTAQGDGTCLELVHRGWERRLKDPREIRDGYDRGWDLVLAHYLEQAA